MENNDNLAPISDWSIRLILKSKLKYSYKKLCFMKRRSLRSENIRKFYESAMVQIQFNDFGYELMYIDEFSINFRHNTAYGWAPLGVKGYLDVNVETFSMSFMVGFSKQRFYGIVGTSTTNNSASFLRFVMNAFKHRLKTLKIKDKRFVIIWDNASLHTSKEVKEFIANTGVIICTITPYSPCLNPAERLILYIKKKTTRIRQRGR